MNLPNDLKYTDSHEWIRAETDGTVTIGITDHAQAALGDLVFVELPQVGRSCRGGRGVRSRRVGQGGQRRLRAAGRQRSSRATTRSPATPEAVNEDAYAAWLFRMKPADAARCRAIARRGRVSTADRRSLTDRDPHGRQARPRQRRSSRSKTTTRSSRRHIGTSADDAGGDARRARLSRRARR